MRDMNDYVLKDWYIREKERAEKYRKQRNALDRENKKLRARIRALDLDHEWVESDDSDLPDPFV